MSDVAEGNDCANDVVFENDWRGGNCAGELGAVASDVIIGRVVGKALAT